MSGMRGLARLYAEHKGHPEDFEKTRKLYEAFEQYFLETYLPTVGSGGTGSSEEKSYLYDWFSPLLEEGGFDRGHREARYFVDQQKNLNYRADHIKKVIGQLHAQVDFPGGVDNFWRSVWVFEKSERIGEQKDLLELMLRNCTRARRRGEISRREVQRRIEDLEKYLSELKKRHPEFSDPVLAESVQKPDQRPFAEILLSREEIREWGVDIKYFHYLVVEHGFTALITNEGVLFLDKKNL